MVAVNPNHWHESIGVEGLLTHPSEQNWIEEWKVAGHYEATVTRCGTKGLLDSSQWPPPRNRLGDNGNAKLAVRAMRWSNDPDIARKRAQYVDDAT